MTIFAVIVHSSKCMSRVIYTSHDYKKIIEIRKEVERYVKEGEVVFI